MHRCPGNMCKKFHSGIICNGPKLEPTPQSMVEWINTSWCIPAMEYYVAMNNLTQGTIAWMNLTPWLDNRGSKMQMTACWLQVCNFRKFRSSQNESTVLKVRSGVISGRDSGRMGVCVLLLFLDPDVVTQVCLLCGDSLGCKFAVCVLFWMYGTQRSSLF